ncbi:MAG: hypothetical protein R3B70_10950 [Polyangiaceae bacterium]
MRFEISHDFDAPLDTIELAVLSPDLGARLASELAQTKIESVNTLTHELRDGRLHRVLEFQASAPFAFLKNVAVPKDAMSWQERTTYSIAEHGATWSVHPKEQYSRYFNSHGTYRLTTLPDGRTRRTVCDGFVTVAPAGTATPYAPPWRSSADDDAEPALEPFSHDVMARRRSRAAVPALPHEGGLARPRRPRGGRLLMTRCPRGRTDRAVKPSRACRPLVARWRAETTPPPPP